VTFEARHLDYAYPNGPLVVRKRQPDFDSGFP